MKLNRENSKNNTIKIFVICWVVIAIIIIIFALIINIPRIGKRAVVVKCAPYTAKVYLDQQDVNNNAISYMPDGEHSVMCFLPGFQIEERKVVIDDNNNSILIELLPVTSDGELIQQEKIDDYYDLEAYAGSISGIEGMAKYNDEAKKLLEFLPYNTDNFGLGMQVEDNHTTVTVTVWRPEYTQMAIDTLREMAKDKEVSLAQYDFRINDFKNQLLEFQDNSATDLQNYILNGYSNRGLNIEINRTGTIDNYQYALISVGQSTGGRVIYRALFEVDGIKLKLLSTPYPVLTTTNTPNISESVLNTLNNTEMILKNNT